MVSNGGGLGTWHNLVSDLVVRGWPEVMNEAEKGFRKYMSEA